MIVTYKYKLYRNKKNKHLHRTINLSGVAYNHCIALHKRYYKLTGKHLSQYALMKHLTKLKRLPKYGWLRLIPSQALQDVVQRIERGYALFFRNLKHGVKTAPPSFRKVHKFKSYTLKQAGWKYLGENRVLIGGRLYKFSKDRPVVGKIKTVTIKRDKLNDLYLCFSLEQECPAPKPASGRMAGFDFGLKTFLTGYDGVENFRVESPQFFRQGINDVKRANRALSKKVVGSSNRKMAKRHLALVHRRIADKRRDWFFKLANELTDKFDYLFFETLNLKGMKKLWGRKVSDLAFGTFLQILEYVAKLKGKIVAYVARFYPSSKTCRHCGCINSNLKINDRRWRCPNCNRIVDRDDNAAVNICREGASSLGVVDIRPLLVGQSTLIPEPHDL